MHQLIKSTAYKNAEIGIISGIDMNSPFPPCTENS